MNKNEIKTGKVTEKELVELYGSDSQKKTYEEKGKLIGSYKSSLLNKVSRYCSIKDCGNRTYKITKVYDYPLPANFNKMNKSLYQYIVPLVLTSLVDGHDKNHKIDITLGKWAREINMVNKNYNLIKYNRETASENMFYSLDTINEFYSKSDDMIEWYIVNALDYLKSAGLIIWRDVYRINKEVSSNQNVIDENGNVYVDITIDSHQATEEEMDYYSQCVDIADKEAGIENAGERYYSKKAKLFSDVLKRELYKEKIKCVYKTYEAYYVNLDKCEFVLKQFGKLNIDKLIKNFNHEFIDMLVSNAEKRFDKKPERYIQYDNKNDYRFSFQGLCEMTINKNAKYIGNKFDKTPDYKLKVSSPNITTD